MMKANELRIGNWAQCYYNQIPYQVGAKDILDCYLIQKEGRYQSTAWTPIPLTDEWLLRFEFEKSGLYRVKKQVYIHDEYGLTDKGYEYRFNYNSIKIKHVHQLQNLYFALTGEELTIKE